MTYRQMKQKHSLARNMAILTPKHISPIFWNVKVFVNNVSYKPGLWGLAVVVVAVGVVAVAPDVVDAVSTLFTLFVVEEQRYETSKCDSKKNVVMKICTQFIISCKYLSPLLIFLFLKCEGN